MRPATLSAIRTFYASMDSPGSDGGYRNVYLLITPLKCYYQRRLRRLDIIAAHSENHRIPFRRLQHWAIQVGDELDGLVYEVTSYWRADGKREMRVNSAKDWRNGRSNPPRQKLFIGVTGWSSSALEGEAYDIWNTMFESEYRSYSRNCQSFVELFKAVIEDREFLTEEKSTEIADLPSSFNPVYAVWHLKQASLIATKWTCRAVKGKGPCPGSHANGNHDTQRQARIPVLRSNGWLRHLNEASKQRDLENDTFRKVAESATHSHRTERKPPKKLSNSRTM